MVAGVHLVSGVRPARIVLMMVRAPSGADGCGFLTKTCVDERKRDEKRRRAGRETREGGHEPRGARRSDFSLLVCVFWPRCLCVRAGVSHTVVVCGGGEGREGGVCVCVLCVGASCILI